MFGRGRQERASRDAARAEAEAEQRALFEALSERPDTVCPFLGVADARVAFRAHAVDEHRCYAFGDPVPLSFEQQERVCLQRGYGNCPRYLRGVLVIPTEEMELLRRRKAEDRAAAAAAAAAPRPAARPVALPVDEAPPESAPRRRRLGVLLTAVVLLLAIGVGGAIAGLTLLRDGAGGVAVDPSPEVTAAATAAATGAATAAASDTPEPTESARPSPTPAATRSPTATQRPTSTAQPTATIPIGNWVYTVVFNDSLSAIAQRYGTQTQVLLDLNPMYASRPDLIHVGEEVVVPCTDIARGEGRCR
jgi:LysM repeat protein